MFSAIDPQHAEIDWSNMAVSQAQERQGAGIDS